MDTALDNAFLSPEFAAAVGRWRRDVYVAVVREAGTIVALLPFQRGRFGIGRAAGLGISNAQAVICAPDFRVDPVALIRACGLGSWKYGNLVSHLAEFRPCTYWTSRGWVMDLRKGYSAYLLEGNRGDRAPRKLRQMQRKLQRELGSPQFVFDTQDADALNHLIRWKSQQYQRSRSRDRFAEEWVSGALRELARCREPGCCGTLSTLSVGGRLVAVHFGIRTPTRLSGCFTAYDPELGKYSPGLQLFLAVAQAAPEHGVGIVDLGGGNDPYKDILASWGYPMAAGRVTSRLSSRVIQRGRHRATRGLQSAVVAHPWLRALLPPTVKSHFTE
jgi:CelD/BcsL family acetyltransferase involved in cellulose biosynthesis